MPGYTFGPVSIAPPGDNNSMRLTVVLLAVRTRRLVERAGEDTGKRLLRVKPVTQADVVHPSVGFTQIARRQQQLALTDITPQALPFVLHKQPLQVPLRVARVAGNLFYT